ncbi:hypothetical protein Pcac1_g28637 [Phytophthora cactorum]|nr:hypothetical protein Pcac1_g28637 [Phytophthora cactorum]
MVKLFCAIVGVAGSAFEVDIDEGQKVGDLKKAIKDQKRWVNHGPLPKLQLFLAKTEGGAWLRMSTLVCFELRKGGYIPTSRR